MLRKLSPEDIDAFTHLRRESFRLAPLSFEQQGDIIFQPTVVLEQLEQTEYQFVLGHFSAAGELTGMMGFTRYEAPKRRHRSYLWGVYLRESERGKGIARQMLRSILAEARRMEGLERIILTVSNHAQGALKLYQSEGFVEFGREKDAARNDGVSMDEIYMLLDL